MHLQPSASKNDVLKSFFSAELLCQCRRPLWSGVMIFTYTFRNQNMIKYDWSCRILIKICRCQCFPQKASHPDRPGQSVVLQNYAVVLCQGIQGQLFVKALLISRELKILLWYSLFTSGMPDHVNWCKNMFLCPRWCFAQIASKGYPLKGRIL